MKSPHSRPASCKKLFLCNALVVHGLELDPPPESQRRQPQHRPREDLLPPLGHEHQELDRAPGLVQPVPRARRFFALLDERVGLGRRRTAPRPRLGQVPRNVERARRLRRSNRDVPEAPGGRDGCTQGREERVDGAIAVRHHGALPNLRPLRDVRGVRVRRPPPDAETASVRRQPDLVVRAPVLRRQLDIRDIAAPPRIWQLTLTEDGRQRHADAPIVRRGGAFHQSTRHTPEQVNVAGVRTELQERERQLRRKDLVVVRHRGAGLRREAGDRAEPSIVGGEVVVERLSNVIVRAHGDSEVDDAVRGKGDGTRRWCARACR